MLSPMSHLQHALWRNYMYCSPGEREMARATCSSTAIHRQKSDLNVVGGKPPRSQNSYHAQGYDGCPGCGRCVILTGYNLRHRQERLTDGVRSAEEAAKDRWWAWDKVTTQPRLTRRSDERVLSRELGCLMEEKRDANGRMFPGFCRADCEDPAEAGCVTP